MSLRFSRHESKRAPAKEEEDDRDLVALEGHGGSLPGEQDWPVVASSSLVVVPRRADQLGNRRRRRADLGLAFGLGRAQAPRRRRGLEGRRRPLPVPKARRRAAWRRVAARGPGACRVRRVVADANLASSSAQPASRYSRSALSRRRPARRAVPPPARSRRREPPDGADRAGQPAGGRRAGRSRAAAWT